MKRPNLFLLYVFVFSLICFSVLGTSAYFFDPEESTENQIIAGEWISPSVTPEPTVTPIPTPTDTP